ncbi:MAG: UDP-2,3-diacylglucosamine diphosphatase LpxI [Deltaproteobacteria bacterium]|nr:UDP-2,3-diacylglucosamine diphosphatase LpxI [Deltaproteobacteria bacterium]
MSAPGPDGGTVGLIAGNQGLPLLAARRLKAQGRVLAVIGLTGETDPGVYGLADHFLEVGLGQIGAMGRFLVGHGVGPLCIVGGVSRRSVIDSYVPDEVAIGIMESLEDFQTDTILRAVAGYLESLGPKVVSVASLVPELLVREGQLGALAPAAGLMAELRLAFFLAKELGRLDCGQTVVVSDRIAVALEGADGTDATIRRGAALCRKPVAVAKAVKPGQDLRLDLPVIGPETISVLTGCGAAGLALDASGLIMIEPDRCLAMADEAGLAVVGFGAGAEAWLGEFRKGLPDV